MGKAKILIVEDERLVARDIENSLKNLGFDVCASVPSGEGAIDKIEGQKPDLVLMDIMLKGEMNGTGAAEQIRSRFDIPVIYLTAYADEEVLERAKKTGPFGYIIKPFEEKDLNTAIEIALYKHKMEKELKESEDKYRNLVEESFDGIFIQRGKNIIFTNKRLNEMLGYGEGELIGQNHWVVYHPDYQKLTRVRAQARLRGEEVVRRYAVKLQRKDGSWFYGEINARPITFPSDKESGIQVWIKDIMERKLAEETLRESEEKYRSLFEESRDAIIFTNQQGRLIDANPAALELFGFKGEKIWKMNFQKLYVNPGEGDRFEKKMKEKGSVQGFETKLHGKGGAEMDCILDVVCRRSDDGSVLEYQGIVRDISEATRAQEALEASQERLSQIINFLPDATMVIDLEGKVIAWNRAIENMTGIKAREMLGKGDYEYAIPFYGERRPVLIDLVGRWNQEMEEKYQYVKRERESLVSETYDPLVKPGGFLWNKASLLYDHNGEVIGAIESIRDITVSKVADEELRESEERYRTLVDNLPVAVYRNTPGPEGQFLMANPAFCKIFGFKNEEEVKKVAPADLYANPKERQQYSDNLVHEGVVKNNERTLVKRDGTPVYTSITASVVYGKDGEISHFDSIMLDITEQKLAEKALRHSEEKYRTILESIEDGYFEVDIAGNLTFFNDSLCKIVGYPRDELMGMNNQQYTDEEYTRKVYQTFNKVYTTGKPHKGFNWEIIRKDGTKRVIEASASLINDGEGGPVGFRGIVRDITAQKSLESQLQQSQKMEAIATLAGGVAHEFNNALMGVMGNIELLKMDLPEDEKRDRYFEAMKDSGLRMSRLTDQLLAYAEGGKYQPKNLKLDDFVIQTLPILQHELSPTVRVETHFPKDISYIKADNAQMQMVLSAILANSDEAMEDEGLICITVENKDVDTDFTKQHPGLKPGDYVCLTIEDDGKGMDEETKTGIFEPFFTTKFQGRGMGMAAVYGIVKNHDGWIYVDSELGKGTVVQIYLPAIEIEVEQPAKSEVEVTTGSGTVLMIEDEDVVIEVTQAMLEMLGYRVMVAKTGKDAIHITETFDGDIDLALLDIKLPDMEGGKVYPLIMKARPDLKVIVFSGYAIDGPAREILDAGAEDFIQKPFAISTLAEKLKEVLRDK